MLTWAIVIAAWALQEKAPLIFLIMAIPADAIIVGSVVEGLTRRK